MAWAPSVVELDGVQLRSAPNEVPQLGEQVALFVSTSVLSTRSSTRRTPEVASEASTWSVLAQSWIHLQIGRASCREGVSVGGVGASLTHKLSLTVRPTACFAVTFTW